MRYDGSASSGREEVGAAKDGAKGSSDLKEVTRKADAAMQEQQATACDGTNFYFIVQIE